MKKRRASRRRDTLGAAQARCRRLRKQVAALETEVRTAKCAQKVNEVWVKPGTFTDKPVPKRGEDVPKDAMYLKYLDIPTEQLGVREGGIPIKMEPQGTAVVTIPRGVTRVTIQWGP